MLCLIPCCIGTLLGCAIGAVVRHVVNKDQDKKKWKKDGPALMASLRETDELIREIGGMENFCRYQEREMEREAREGEGIAEFQGPGGYMKAPPTYNPGPQNRPCNTYRGERFYE